MEKLKGLKWYLTVVILGLSFYTYSQVTGWRWLWSTPTEQSGSGSRPTGYRYFFHK
jgi:hypothetical protein